MPDHVSPAPRRRPAPWQARAWVPVTGPRVGLDPVPAEDAAVAFAVVDADGERVGTVALHDLDAVTAAARLAVRIDPAHRRLGFATDALRTLISAALRSPDGGGWGLNRLHATAPGSDMASRGLARALGLRREVRRRQDVWVDGVGVDDTYGWAVLADEWDPDAGRMRRDEADPDVGVGPHPLPWPDDDRHDPVLLRDGDRRNVADRYRWWRHDRIVADLAANAHPFHVAIENWRHDSNIGTVVRNANAFGAAGVHVVGRRSWNRRGAMVTDRYMAVHHHADVEALARWAGGEGLVLVGIDNLPGSVSLFDHPPPERCVLLLGQEGPGLSDGARRAVSAILHIPQHGSTRSINAGVASGIAMATWVRLHGRTG